MELVTKDSLIITEKDIDTISVEAVNVYLEMEHEQNGISDFYDRLRKSPASKSVNLEEFKSFFNKRLVLEYMIKNKIDMFNLSREVNQDLKKQISNAVLESVTKIDGKISLASDNLDFASCKNSFYFNIPNDNLIASLSNLYTLVSNANVPYLIEINRDLNNYNDSIVLKTPNEEIEKVIEIINQFIATSQDVLILPMRVVKRVASTVGYAYDGYLENVYTTLIEAIDEIVSNNEIINDVERYNRIKGIQHSIGFRENLENVFKDKLKQKLIKSEEMVINVEKPTIEFETFVNDINNIDANHDDLDIFLEKIPEIKTESLEDSQMVSPFPEIDEIIDRADEHIVVPTDDNIVEHIKPSTEPVSFPEIDRIIEEVDNSFAQSEEDLSKNNESMSIDKLEFASPVGNIKESKTEGLLVDIPEVGETIPEFNNNPLSQASEDLNKNNESVSTDKLEFASSVGELTDSMKDNNLGDSAINDSGLNSVIENVPLSHEELTSMVKKLEDGENPRIERAQKYSNFVDEISTLNRQMIGSNGDNTTLLDYLDEENVLTRIPLDADIILEDGQIIKGEEFIKAKLIPYALEVGNSNIDVVMNAYGARIAEKQEKTGFLRKLFK